MIKDIVERIDLSLKRDEFGLEFIRMFKAEMGYPPNYREIAQAMSIQSGGHNLLSSVHAMLRRLSRSDQIELIVDIATGKVRPGGIVVKGHSRQD